MRSWPENPDPISDDIMTAGIAVVWSLFAVGLFLIHWSLGFWLIAATVAIIWFAELRIGTEDPDDTPTSNPHVNDPDDHKDRKDSF